MHQLSGRAIFCSVARKTRRGEAITSSGSMEGAKMLVEFGASVFGKGGKRLGEVNGLLVDAGTKRATSIVVDEGLFDSAKHMIAVSAIVRGDQDGLHLEESAARTESESSALDSEEVSFPQRVEPSTTFIPAAGVGGPLYADTPPAPGDYPDSSSFFDIAPLDPPAVEVESNLGENEVVLGKGTRAISSDHHHLGDVVALELGEMGQVQSVAVSEGLIFKERSTFALADIDEFGTDAVRLRLTKAAATR
jgi:PRC-barrel domain